MTVNRPGADKVLVALLWVGGVSGLFALVAVFMPVSWMAAAHRWLGLGEMPISPVVEYLARSLSAFYALLGALCLVLATDLERYRPLVRFLAAAVVLMGVVFTGVDWAAVWWGRRPGGAGQQRRVCTGRAAGGAALRQHVVVFHQGAGQVAGVRRVRQLLPGPRGSNPRCPVGSLGHPPLGAGAWRYSAQGPGDCRSPGCWLGQGWKLRTASQGDSRTPHLPAIPR